MENRQRLLVYSAIIRAVKNKPMTFNELQTKLQKEESLSDGKTDFAQRTFQRYLKDINDLFGIEIKANGHNQYVIISEGEYTHFDNRLFEYFNIFSAMSQLKKINQTVYTEVRCEQGTENMFVMVHAIINTFKISFTHKKYGDGTISRREVKPYAIKESMGRWYLIAVDQAKNGEEILKTFGLDRITDVTVEKTSFKRKNIDINEEFEGCYGIINVDWEEIQNVRLAFDSFKANYIKSYPLHSSQKEICSDDKETIFEYDLRITQDLVMAVLSHGKEVRVKTPQRLKDEVQSIAKQMLDY